MTDNDASRVLSERYLLLDRLGSGGMGTVWRAKDQLLDRVVAAKEMLLGAKGAEYATQAARVRREAYTIARITHPNVVNVYDLVDDGERLWLVMELVDGPSLKERVNAGGPMGHADAAGIGLQLLGALDAVHAAGVLHRDIKPGNVLLRPDGGVVLCDFGIAALSGTESLTETGAVVGSLGYIAPERLSGQTSGPPSDLFSLGVTLCVLLSGRTPFARPEPAGTLHAVAAEEPDIPPEAGPLRPLLEALLRKNPADRPSVAEASEELRSLTATGSAAHDRPAGGGGTAGESGGAGAAEAGAARRRRRLGLAALSAAVVIAVAIAGGAFASRWGGTDTAGTAGTAAESEIPAAETASAKEQKPDSGGDTPDPAEGTADAAEPSASPDSVPAAGPTRTDAVMPIPGAPNTRTSDEYWMFSGDHYIRGGIAASGYPVGQRRTEISPLKSWDDTFANLPGFQDKIDAVLRVPGLGNEYWVFSGSRYIRIRIAGAEDSFDDTLVAGPNPISDWESAFGGLAHDGIDAVMPTPDDPSQYWVFVGDQYVRTTLDGEGPGGSATIGPANLDAWSTLSEFASSGQGIDAVMPVPNERNQYWAFAGDQYMKIGVADTSYEDTVLHGPEPLRNWSALD
ncbi:hypothetical protein GCM10027570_29090 [Streptomonospora sediminis]